eukprot:941232-Amphidinium_carterae.1
MGCLVVAHVSVLWMCGRSFAGCVKEGRPNDGTITRESRVLSHPDTSQQSAEAKILATPNNATLFALPRVVTAWTPKPQLAG